MVVECKQGFGRCIWHDPESVMHYKFKRKYNHKFTDMVLFFTMSNFISKDKNVSVYTKLNKVYVC